eukprot:jgi/Mesvir1/14277/Mv09709-RA.1
MCQLCQDKRGYEYKGVQRWTKAPKVTYKLKDCAKVIVPVHQQVHWCLAVINLRDQAFEYYDSMGEGMPPAWRIWGTKGCGSVLGARLAVTAMGYLSRNTPPSVISICTMAAARYIVDEVKDKSGEVLDVSKWERRFVTGIPQQNNGYDCGVFMVKFADFVSRDKEPRFSWKDMDYFRQRLVLELLNCRVF